VAVGTHTEYQEIKDGDFDSGSVGKYFDEFLLIRVGELLGIGNEIFIDFVDLFGGNRNLGEEALIA